MSNILTPLAIIIVIITLFLLVKKDKHTTINYDFEREGNYNSINNQRKVLNNNFY